MSEKRDGAAKRGVDSSVKPAKERKRRKLAQANGPNNPMYIQLLGVGSPDSTPSAIFVTEHSRALFNCGGGAQRFCNEHKMRLSKIDHIFLSNLAPENTGGLPGMILSLAESGKEELYLYGPPGLKQFVASTRFFMRTSNVKVHEFDLDPTVQNSPVDLSEGVKVWPLVLRADSDSGGKYCISYLCETPLLRGRFDPKASDELGVPPQRRSELVRGQAITLDDGSIVSPSQVLSAGERGPMLAMIFCQEKDFVESLNENRIFKTFLESATAQVHNHQDSECSTAGIGVAIIHFCSLEVLKCEPYQRLFQIGEQGKHVSLHHILVNFWITRDVSPFRAAHKLQKM